MVMDFLTKTELAGIDESRGRELILHSKSGLTERHLVFFTFNSCQIKLGEFSAFVPSFRGKT